MAVEYTNRKGDLYRILQGRTKTGKPKYYCSRKPGGVPVESLPPEFEIHEHPDTATVSVRKVRPSRILEQEIQFIDAQIRSLAGIDHFILDRNGDEIIVYLCDRDPKQVDQMIGKLLGPFGIAGGLGDWARQRARYSPVMRFTLVDEVKRHFQLERWCFRSQVDDWIPISAPAQTLEKLTRKFVPHLGRESFYELF